MIDRKLKFAKALRRPDEADVKRITEHFQAQKDMHTTCPRCRAAVRGSYEQITAHQCDFGDLIGA